MQRLPGLDLLRSLAILWVMLFHGWAAGLGTPSAPVARFGWMGVDLFFALSGFLIGSQLLKAYAQGSTPALGQFYSRRAFRVLPAYLVVLGFYFAVPAFREAPGIQPLWQFLTFTENLLIDYTHNQAFSHAWSLCVEEHFYLFFPLIVWALMRRPSWKLTLTVCLGILAAGMFLRGYVWLHFLNPDHGGVPHSPLYIEKIYYPTHMRLDGLLAGVVVAALKWFRPALWEKALRHAGVLLALGLVCVAGAIGLFQVRYDFWPAVLGYPLLSVGLALIVFTAVSPHSVLGKIRIPGATAIATISYSLYLSHKMVWHIVKRSLPELVAQHSVQSFAIYTVVALAVATLLYGLVERPFLLLRDHLTRSRA